MIALLALGVLLGDEADVCVYGGTSGGVVAAVQAARMGKSVILLEPGRHLGGMTSGGLSAVDIGEPRSVGGLAREYFTRLAAGYGKTLPWDAAHKAVGGSGGGTGGAFSIEPHRAERLFEEMLREAEVEPRFGARLASVTKEGARIVEVALEDGRRVRARMWIDATYEGDLMAKAGVAYTLVRESNARYGERHNGLQFSPKYAPRREHAAPRPNGRTPSGQGVWDRDVPIDPWRIPGDPASGLIPFVEPAVEGVPGDAAPGVQAYCFRLCLTDREDNRRPLEAPPGYDPARYELHARALAQWKALGDDVDLRWFSKHDPVEGGKWDFNTATFGANLPGTGLAWAEASYAERERLAREHELYQRGLLWFLANDPRVPEKVRAQMRRFGLPKDEFPDTGGWPHQLYIRESRRMVGDLVLTEHHTHGRAVAPRSLGLASYGTDCHEVRRVVRNGVVAREGKVGEGRGGAGPYPVGLGAVVPRAAECENLLVTFAVSASHTAFASIRMEPVHMILSQSAATAAAHAIDESVRVQDVDYEKLRARLEKDGTVLVWKGRP